MNGYVVPRLLVFNCDIIAEGVEEGVAVGSDLVAWGVQLSNGKVATWPPDDPVGVTLRDSIADACFELDAWVSNLDPRHLVWRGGELVLMPDLVGNTAPAVGPGETAG